MRRGHNININRSFEEDDSNPHRYEELKMSMKEATTAVVEIEG